MAVLECPFCNQALEIQPPDRLHIAYSFERPLVKSYYGEVIERKVICQNHKCGEIIKIYWYAPLDYFGRV